MQASIDRSPPSAAVAIAFILFVGTIAAIAMHQKNKREADPVPVETVAVIESRALRFLDAGDAAQIFGGTVRVIDEANGTDLGPLHPTDGFVRTALNGLAFERVKRNVQGPPVFTLTRWGNQKITLDDPSTGARIDVGEFGPGNKAVFLRFLPHREARS